MSITSKIIKLAAPIPKIEKFDSFLFVGPHPDDIEIGAGATIAKLAKEGKKITFLICTDGRYGDGHVEKNVTRDELVEIRKRESIESAKALGVTDVRFLNLSDGGFYDFDILVKGIAGVTCELKPDIIFAPDPNSGSECHPDHLNVGLAVRKVAVFMPYPGIATKLTDSETEISADVKAVGFYMTARPNTFVNTSGYFKTQLHSIFDVHLSQFPKDGPDASSVTLYLKLRAKEYGLKHFCKTAEGFRVLGQTHMHCLPEAGLK